MQGTPRPYWLYSEPVPAAGRGADAPSTPYNGRSGLLHKHSAQPHRRGADETLQGNGEQLDQRTTPSQYGLLFRIGFDCNRI